MLISGRMHRIRPDRAKASAFATGPANTQVFVRFEPLTCLNKQAFGLHQLLKQLSCALPTWWLWRGGCTRSLSEHGRETPLRPWYFVLRRGRVGRCQVCKSQLHEINLLITKTAQSRTKGRSHSGLSCYNAVQSVFCLSAKTWYRGVEQPGSSSGS